MILFVYDLRGYRKDKKLTQSDIEVLSGIDQAIISKYERGLHVTEHLNNTFGAKLEGIESYLRSGSTSQFDINLLSSIVTRLDGLSSDKLGQINELLTKLLTENSGLIMEQAEAYTATLSSLLTRTIDSGNFVVDIQGYSPYINTGDILHLSQLKGSSPAYTIERVVVAIYLNNDDKKEITIAHAHIKAKGKKTRKKPILAVFTYPHGSGRPPQILEWDQILHLYHVNRLVRHNF